MMTRTAVAEALLTVYAPGRTEGALAGAPSASFTARPDLWYRSHPNAFEGHSTTGQPRCALEGTVVDVPDSSGSGQSSYRSLHFMPKDEINALADQGADAPPMSDEFWAASLDDQQRSVLFWFKAGCDEVARMWRHVTARPPTRWEQWILGACVAAYGEAFTIRAIYTVAARAGFGWSVLGSTRDDGSAPVEIKANAVWELLERWGFEARVGLGG